MATRFTKAVLDEIAKKPQHALRKLSDNDIARLLEKADKAYHSGERTPLFSDNVYDIIRDTLAARDPDHKYLKKVGSSPSPKKQKVLLPVYMGSMDKNKGDLKALKAFAQKYPGAYMVSDKLDGVSCLLHVNKDSVQLLTRGDGTHGQDITNLLPVIQGIPTGIATRASLVTVRGELIVTKADFDHIQETIDKSIKNARNMVSGLVNAKAPNMELAKYVRFVPYSVIYPDDMRPSVQMQWLLQCGFSFPVYHRQVYQLKDFEHLSEILGDRRELSEYEVDGIIVAHDEYHAVQPGQNPDYAFAFKSMHMMDTAEVTVTDVVWKVSKDGYLIPTVIFDPVQLSGVSVQKATGFNGKFIWDNRIGPGTRIMVTRSGDVIPHILKVTSAPGVGEAAMPDDVPYEWSESGVHIVALDEAASALRRLEHFFTVLDVPGMRAGTVTKLYKAGFDSPGKVWKLKVADLMKVPGFQKKSAENLVEGIREAEKRVSVIQLMEASGTFGRGMAEKNLEVIMQALPAYQGSHVLLHSRVPSLDMLTALYGISEKRAEAFIKGLADFREFLATEELAFLAVKACDNYVKKQEEKMKAKAKQISGQAEAGMDNNKLAGQVVVFTGFRDADLAGKVEGLGGSVEDSLTRKTTILVYTKETSKVTKALEKGTPRVMTRDEFAEFVG